MVTLSVMLTKLLVVRMNLLVTIMLMQLMQASVMSILVKAVLIVLHVTTIQMQHKKTGHVTTVLVIMQKVVKMDLV